MNNDLCSILMDAFFIIILAWCSHSDIKKRTVSNLCIILLLCLDLVHMALMLLTGSIWWQYLAGLLLAIPFFIAWFKNMMGAGDVKLIISIALYLGLLNTLISFALMVPVFAIFAIHSWNENKTMKCTMPLAPVLAIGAAGTIMLGYVYVLAQI